MIPDHSRDHLMTLGKSGSAFQSDRDFRQKRRQADRASIWMAVRWLVIGAGAIWASQFLPW